MEEIPGPKSWIIIFIYSESLSSSNSSISSERDGSNFSNIIIISLLGFENLIALPIKFNKTYLMRSGSEKKSSGKFSSYLILK